MIVTRWRNACWVKNSLIASSSSTTIHYSSASFHSTPISYEKWRSKWNSDFQKGHARSKSYIRYRIRQKRSDAKKALKSLLFNGGSCRTSFKDYDPVWNFDGREANQSDTSGRNGKPKSSARRAAKSQQKKMKRKFRKDCFSEDEEDHSERIFRATFGNKWYTWSFNSWRLSGFESSTSGFEWRENWDQHSTKDRRACRDSDFEADDEPVSLGLASDRVMLGLPPRGPLKIEDVKNAFRLSALKWHPDKHQGPSQSAAEEKFKSCANAYKSLCSAFSAG